ncbi:hypothetical protein MTO96_050777 [Rhipicephalus appendiculatus]
MEIDHEELRRLLIQPRNPNVLEVRRIKNSTTVVILFEGLRVPNYVMCGPSMIKCTLYRRQTDVCYACGRLGHRADVCPTPENAICRGCGISSPGDQHVCSPKQRRERRNFDKDFPPIDELYEPANKSKSRSSRGALPKQKPYPVQKPFPIQELFPVQRPSRSYPGASCHGDRVG